MRVVRGDYTEALGIPRAIVVAPTNGVIRNGRLVMGAGAARALANKAPFLPGALARAIAGDDALGEGEEVYLYGFARVNVGGQWYGALQTKAHFRNHGDHRLILLGAVMLYNFLAQNDLEAHMAYPGIGHGGLDPEDVRLALEYAALIAGQFTGYAPQDLMERLVLYVKGRGYVGRP